MKLTNYIRDAFIASVLNDTPSVDYTEQARAAAVKDIVAQLPKKVRAVWEDKDLRDWVETTTVYLGNGLGSATVPGLYGEKRPKLSEAGEKAVAALCELHSSQRSVREDLHNKLRSVAYACGTRKALAEALPEFEKYLPAEAQTARSLPVVANVVASFVKAGWPKDKKAETA